MNAAGTRVYVTNVGAVPGSVSVVNTLTNAIIAHINFPVFAGTFFGNLILSPTLPAAYLAYIPDQVGVINTTTNALGTPITIPVSGGDTVSEIAVNPAGTRL